MKIVNNTELSYKEIGNVIDQIIEMGKGTTHYVGQIEFTTFETLHNGRSYEVRVQLRYLKRYVEWRFDEMKRH